MGWNRIRPVKIPQVGDMFLEQFMENSPQFMEKQRKTNRKN